MAITTIYRVSVDVPEAVWRGLGNSRLYETRVAEATQGSLSSGSNAHSDVEEWADFHDYGEAVACESALEKLFTALEALVAD